MADAVRAFEEHRATLLGLAYRMLGDYQRAEDMVQDAWLKWQSASTVAVTPRAFLIRMIARMCLNELDSAPRRREQPSGERLPEPVCLEASGLARVEALDMISMAFIVLLQRLTPAERAVLLLREVFEFEYSDIAELIHKTEPACRQLLRRARDQVARARQAVSVEPSEHARLLRAFVAAASSGDADALAAILAEDVMLIADAGEGGARYGRTRNLPRPLHGAAKVAAFVAAVAAQGAAGLVARERLLNGQPALVLTRDGRAVTAILLACEGGKISAIFMCADPSRLGHV
jgi:RNA polymerase sigma-70 factor (ECF subfamily)